MRCFVASGELVLAVACWFGFFVVIWCVCVRVLWVGLTFPGLFGVCRGWLFGDNRLILLHTVYILKFSIFPAFST